MPIDPDVAVGATLPEIPFTWTESDVLLYHLAVGAGAAPGDNVSEQALRWTVEGDRLQVLPSFGIVSPTFHLTEPPQKLPGCDIDLSQVLHGTQAIEVHGPIPTSGSATVTTRITDVWDKGSAAVIVQEGTATAADGTDLWSTRSSMFVRGEGGWGGERGPSVARLEVPERDPDLDASYSHDTAAGTALPALRRPQPAALRPGVREGGRFPGADPARSVFPRHRPPDRRRRPPRR